MCCHVGFEAVSLDELYLDLGGPWVDVEVGDATIPLGHSPGKSPC